jgi:hypothetical protein
MRKFPNITTACLKVNTDQGSVAKDLWLRGTNRFWALPVVVIFLFLGVLSGCGSDSTSSSGIKDKTKTVPPQTKKMQKAPTQDKAEAAKALFFEAQPGMDVKELAKQVAAAKKLQDPRLEVFPGVTLGELQAKHTAAAKKMQDPRIEVFPGVNLGELQTRQEAAAQKMQDPLIEVFPGVNLTELQARQAAATQNLQKMQALRPEVVPGLAAGELKNKQAAQKMQDLRLMDVFPPTKP